MGTGYTRQSVADIVDGNIIYAAPVNAELNQIQAAFDSVSGHSHDGTTGESSKINLATSISGVLPTINGGIGGINELNGTTAPTAGDDAADGYAVGSMWVDTTNDRVYVAVDVTNGAAIWQIQSNTVGWQPLDDTLTALAAYNTTGIVVQTAADTFAGRSLVAPAAGITITNPAGTAGDPTFALSTDLAALENLGATGIAVRTATNTWAQRTITGTANELTVTNGDGVSGNPTLSLPASLTFTGKTITDGTFNNPTISGATYSGPATFSDLTATGAFTSKGIDDNASTIVMTLAGTNNVIWSTDGGATVQNVSDNTSRLVVAGGNAYNAGGNLLLYGGAHASAAGDILFKDGDSNVWFYDKSNNSQYWYAPAGTGKLILESNNLYPFTNDDIALGSATMNFSDLFLAAGGVINWADGNYTLAHSTGLLTASGGLTVSGAFTSLGIDDNASIPMIIVADNDIRLSGNQTTVSLGRNVNTGILQLSGGISNNGANIVLYGSSAPSSTGNDLQFRNNSALTYWYDSSATSHFWYATPNTGALTLTTSALSPFTNDLLSLGTSSLQWADLYLATGGTINFNNGDVTISHAANALSFGGADNGYNFDAVVNVNSGQIKFPATQIPSSDVNTLDDYEEGTWTPVLNINNSTTGITYATRSGVYTKVGNLIHIWGEFTLTNKGASSGSLTLTGMPFAGSSSDCGGLIGTKFDKTNSTAQSYSISGNATTTTIDLKAQYVNHPHSVGNIVNTQIQNTFYFGFSGTYTTTT